MSNSSTHKHQGYRIIDPATFQGESVCEVVTPDRTLEVHTVHTEPRISIVKNVVSQEEASIIIEVLDSYFERSTVGYDSSSNMVDESRTSYTCYLRRSESPIIEAIEKRISSLVDLPERHIEPFQVLRYQVGQKFSPHYDFLRKQDEFSHICGDRKYTCLMYLNSLPSDEVGGGTQFHEVGIEIRPSLGTAVLWENLDKNGSPDYRTLHSGEPPQSSVKYAMTAWIREGEFPY